MIGEEFGAGAVIKGRRLGIELSLSDIEDLNGHVAAEANHTREKKLQQRLYHLSEKLQKLLDNNEVEE